MSDLSLGEVEAYARRAARGAGMSWGLAEEAGKATRWLAERGLPGVQVLLQLLTANDGRDYASMAPIVGDDPWRSADGNLCPICCGTALSDRAADMRPGEEVALLNLASPLLLAPFLDRICGTREGFCELILPEFRMAVSTRGVTLATGDESDLLVEHTTDARVALDPGRLPEPTHLPGAERAATPTSVWRALDELGKRTYVPASTESRSRGAGAGRIDND